MPTQGIQTVLPTNVYDGQIIIVSNRGPAQFHVRKDGRIFAQQSSGGLATALVSAASNAHVIWIAVAGSEADRLAFTDRTYRTVRIGNVAVTTRYVVVPPKMYSLYYNDTSNRTLWFLHHYLFDSETQQTFTNQDYRAWEEGYEPVNALVANAVIDELYMLSQTKREKTIVLLQDYHLYLVPGLIRQAMPDVRMEHFIHIPWPGVRYWQLLPQKFSAAIMTSMGKNDIIGLQTTNDVDNFVGCYTRFQQDTRVESYRKQVKIAVDEHTVLVNAYPIAIDPERVTQLARSRSAQSALSPFMKWFDRKVILRVDRIEPSKNIIRGLQAFDWMLEQHPELVKEVRFVMMLVPSREDLRHYRRYGTQIRKLIEQINAKYGDESDPVIIPIYGNNQARALAAMQRFDVMLVNSIVDGMHLGAKEGAAVNENNGVLVISRNAGVYEAMAGGACLGISPFDLHETAQVLYQALTMTRSMRFKMSIRAKNIATSEDVTQWLRKQIHDLEDIFRRVDIVPLLDSIGLLDVPMRFP